MIDAPIPPDTIRPRLLSWYDRNARELPWRGTGDPYAVWVSEVMLQQTRVESAVPYFERWMERFPSVEALAEAEEREVLEEWEGLGYYSRARRLLAAARRVRDRHGGRIPRDPGELRGLPGVGAYTAGALASIAFGHPVAAVDGNVRRVVSRLVDLPAPSDRRLAEIVTAWIDPERPGDFNQALMELGATVCTPRSPRCGRCPLSGPCGARAAGTVEERPAPRPRRPVRESTFAVLVARDERGRLVMGRRPTEGLLGGMWAFPEVEFSPDGHGGGGGEDGDDAVLRRACLRAAGALAGRIGLGEPGLSGPAPVVTHRYSHIAATYLPVEATVTDRTVAPEEPWSWIEPDEAVELPLPRVQRILLERTSA